MPTSYMDDMQKALAQIDPISLLDKIAGFRRLDIANMSDAEISKAILDVLCWNGRFLYHTNIKKYPAGTRFFRVKKLDGSNIPNPRFRKYHDYWETLPEYINTYGRLNKPGEPLLYVSSDLLCSIKEVRINSGSYFAAIQYTARQDIKVNIIGGEFDYDGLGMTDKRARLIHELYNGFLRDEFSRDVGKGTEYLYKLSCNIAKDYFDLPPRAVQDAWGYSSVLDKQKYNTCFRPDIAHELLELNGAMICKTCDNRVMHVLLVAVGSDTDNNILFYDIGSEQQKQAFPEIAAPFENRK